MGTVYSICGFHLHEGARLYYEIHGEGEPLLLLHGNGEDGRIFDKMLPDLAARYKVILPDTRGHGRSERGDAPLDFFTLAYDVCALMDHLGIDSAHLLGFSDGGNTALHMAWNHPFRVRSLVLLGANLSPAGIKPPFQILCVLAWGKAGILSLFCPKARKAFERLGLMVLHPNMPASKLRYIAAPALVLAGERDIVRQNETLRIARYLPRGAFALLKGAGHDLPVCRHIEVNRMVLRFLKEQRSG